MPIEQEPTRKVVSIDSELHARIMAIRERKSSAADMPQPNKQDWVALVLARGCDALEAEMDAQIK